MEHTLEYVTIGVYLAFLLGISIYVSRINQSVSDYVRGERQPCLHGRTLGVDHLRRAGMRAGPQCDLHRAVDSADRGGHVGRYHPATVRSRGRAVLGLFQFRGGAVGVVGHAVGLGGVL